MSNHDTHRVIRRSVNIRSSFRPQVLLVALLALCPGCVSKTGKENAIAFPGRESTKQESYAPPARNQGFGSVDTPTIALDRTTYDFGEIRPISKNMATFRITNAGNGVLKITNVQKCCGAAIQLDKKELAAGESAVLTAEYAGGPAAQELSKKIRLFTNDPKNPQIELSIIGKVVQTLVWTPTRFELAAYKEDIVCPEITIRSADGKPFAIKGFSATGQYLTADFDSNSKASQFTLKPKADRAKLAAAPFPMGRVKIDVAHRDYEAIYLDFEIKPVFEVTPPRIFVVNAEPGRAVVRTLQLHDRRTTSSGDVSHEIESVKFKNGARVEVRSVTDVGRGCEMNLVLWPAGDQTQGTLWSDQLTVQMKEGRQVTVPVNILFKPQPVSSAANPASHS